jgi:uncharacterized protein (TIGR00661 family)
MARIVYGVAGEGFGHSSRSHLIGQHLIDAGHDVLFVASSRSLSYLRTHFGPRVKEIFGLRLIYHDRTLSATRTAAANLRRFVESRHINRTLYRDVLEPFEPDLVLSDFEPFSAWWAWRCGIPFISIDHQHLLSLCELRHEAGHLLPRLHAEAVTRCHYIGATAYIILNFFRTPVRSGAAAIAPPVVRPVVQRLRPSEADHVLVYTTDASWKDRPLAALNGFTDQRFVIYGLNENRQIGNCTLKKTSTQEFVRDLASSQGVISTAGFSLLSECLHLRKKMLLLPIRGQYEQIVNAHYAQRLGFGLHRDRLDGPTLAEYLDWARTPIADREDILWPDNESFFEVLDGTIEMVLAPSGLGLSRPRVAVRPPSFGTS